MRYFCDVSIGQQVAYSLFCDPRLIGPRRTNFGGRFQSEQHKAFADSKHILNSRVMPNITPYIKINLNSSNLHLRMDARFFPIQPSMCPGEGKCSKYELSSTVSSHFPSL
ncbi:hypothetical protein PoB_004071300 [Plakobranchus ocellatus]|uniref:Uncharacterized protein n=1 Tax=Plakobranchus ocellatus TaxID=259542 RepID=A0AAV4B528_9GAST|nr:hypothetical protein PoB_004071300 [Plakobranchus ocellatus]